MEEENAKVYTKKQSISQLEEGNIIDDIFVVKIKRGIAEYSKGYSFTLILTDSSGKSIEYVYWGGREREKVRAIYDSIKADAVIRIRARVSSFRGKLQLSANEDDLIKVLEEDEYRKEDFVKPARKDTEELYQQLLKAIESVENEEIKHLLRSIFDDDEIKEKLKGHPGAISIHHNWMGGLLEHILEVLDFCMTAERNFPSLNHDLLVAGALLHDIGKLEEMEVTTRIKGTNEGQLLGHVMLGFHYVAKKMEEMGMDENLKNKILHIMVSHHGKNENGSPKEPMFPEALTVYLADEMSARIAQMTEFVEEAKESTEDDFMYSKRQKVNIFLR